MRGKVEVEERLASAYVLHPSISRGGGGGGGVRVGMRKVRTRLEV